MADPNIPAPNPTLLVVDDDAVMRELLTALLGLEGYAVHAVDSGRAALAFLASTSANVILVDLQMPGMTGAAFASQLNSVRSVGTVLLAMSGSPLPSSEKNLYDGFLQKPFAVEDFTAAVTHATQHGAKWLAEHQPSTAVISPAISPQLSPLDDAIYTKLAAMLPPPQLRELYQLTLNDVNERLDRMAAALAQGNFAECRAEAHAIKGSCGMVGAAELNALAAQVETAPEAGKPPLADFADACVRLQRMLDQRF